MCCGEPCLVAEWYAGVYGYRCLNCGAFIRLA